MKPQLLRVPNAQAHSFSVRQDKMTNINNRWHYHPEVELIHFHRGSGTQFVGDNIKRFFAGDIVLVGSNLPHYWRFDAPSEAEDSSGNVVSTVIHFTPDFWGEKFLDLSENKPVRLVLEKAGRGLLLTGRLKDDVQQQIACLDHAEGPDRIMTLMKILYTIYRSEEAVMLSSIGYQSVLLDSENDRINDIYEYTLNNFHKKIYLEHVAGIAGLVPNSFCRYFKSRTGKTYLQFLTEIRVGNACKLLMDDNINLKEVCYESGFANFSCFHKRFKEITGQSPHHYRITVAN